VVRSEEGARPGEVHDQDDAEADRPAWRSVEGRARAGNGSAGLAAAAGQGFQLSRWTPPDELPSGRRTETRHNSPPCVVDTESHTKATPVAQVLLDYQDYLDVPWGRSPVRWSAWFGILII
jgi:hypothetical protein